MVSPGWITPRLAISDGPETAGDVAQLLRAGVTDVVDVRAEFDASPLYAGSGIRFARVPYTDNGTCQPTALAAAVAALDAAWNRGGRTVVNCAAGQYRSPAVVYAWLRKRGASPDAAWATVLSGRGNAQTQYLPCVEAWIAGRALAAPPGGTSGGALTTSRPRWPLVLLGAGALYAGWRVYQAERRRR